jgi:hypothetical protein
VGVLVEEEAMIVTRIPNDSAPLASRMTYIECRNGVQRRFWREQYRFQKAGDPEEKEKRRDNLRRLRIIKKELNQLLNEL